MILKPLNSSDYEIYDKLNLEDGNLFSSRPWLANYDNVQLYGIYNKEQLIGGFHLYIIKKRGVKLIVNAPYSPNIGLFVKCNDKDTYTVNSFYKEIVTDLEAFINTIGFDVLDISLPYKFMDLQPFVWKGYDVSVKYSYVIDLNKIDEESLIQQFSNERKRQVKKAMSDKLDLDTSKNKKIIIDLIEQTYKRQSLQLKNKKYLTKIISSDFSETYITKQNNDALAGSLMACDTHSAYYLIGGLSNNNTHQGAMAYAMYQSILIAKSKHLHYFDFEGSMLPGVERFFRGFGGEMINYFSVSKRKFPYNVLLKILKK